MGWGWTIRKAKNTQVLNWQLCLPEQMWPSVSVACSFSAKAKLEKFTSRVYDFHQGFLNFSVGGRKTNFSPTFCNDSYSLQYF